MAEAFDIVVAGGSIAGLTFAAEAAKAGVSVLVAEEHDEIGEPEKCDGLVSLRGLRRYDYVPRPEVVQNRIASALIHSPRGRSFSINAAALDVVVLDRSAFDKQVASQAVSNGAEVRTGARVTGAITKDGSVRVTVGGESVSASYLIDATGPSPSLRRGIVPAAKYEVEGDWIREPVVEVFLNAELYPGFFAWVIPFAPHRAKVGAAGYGISPFKALDRFLDGRKCSILRRVSAPIYVGGPASEFVDGRTIKVGESAGQVKPTTAGGIMTSIAGAVYAARSASESLKRRDPSLLARYRRDWDGRFLKEMRAMLRLRSVFERLSNADLEALVDALATPKLILKLSQTDFDFHASALLGSLGLPGLLRVAKVIASAEVRSILVEG
jgi:digeranylgeranylglycerophospholipid reductase